jgi:hypothetical protein
MDGVVIICDYAQANNGKLYVTGGAVNLVGTASVEAPHPVSLWAGIVVTVPWQAHNQPHKLVVSLRDQDENKVPIGRPAPGVEVREEDEGSFVAQFNVGRPAILQPGDETPIPLAVPLSVGLPALGSYHVTLEIDGTEVARASFRAVSAIPGT